MNCPLFPLSLNELFYWIGLIVTLQFIISLIYERLTIPIGQPAHAKKHNGNKQILKETPTLPVNKQEYDAIVLGAGASGLAIGYQLCHYNKKKKLNCLIIESLDKPGNMWQKRYDRLHLHTPKAMSELPGLPMPHHYPEFVSKLQFTQYLESYALIHNLPILYKYIVTSATYNKQTKLWQIQIKNVNIPKNDKKLSVSSVSSDDFVNVGVNNKHEQKDDNSITDGIITIYSRVLINCCGRDAIPKIPIFNNSKSFLGDIIHSSDYKNASKYINKNVLIVGCGNSAIDIVLDCYEYGVNNLYQIVRSPIQIIRREFVRLNSILPSFILNNLPKKLMDILLIKEMKDNFSDLGKYGIKLKLNPTPMTLLWEQLKAPILDIGWSDLVKKQKVNIIKNEIKSFYENGVILTDNKKIECDVVILSTGFKANVNVQSFLGENITKSIENEYKLIKSGYEIKNNKIEQLYFCGFADYNGRIYEIGIESKRIIKDLYKKYF